jgi:hypothetical protein
VASEPCQICEDRGFGIIHIKSGRHEPYQAICWEPLSRALRIGKCKGQQCCTLSSPKLPKESCSSTETSSAGAHLSDIMSSGFPEEFGLSLALEQNALSADAPTIT